MGEKCFVAKEFGELTNAEVYEILKARSEVFMLEQKIYCQDCDGVDYDSLHCFIKEDNKIVAYLRAYYTDDDGAAVKVGRVLTTVRGIGLGRELIEKSIPVIKSRMKCSKISINAQTHAEGFYKKLGFETVSGEFLEEGVLHVEMKMDI